jgi:hypothetical protein
VASREESNGRRRTLLPEEIRCCIRRLDMSCGQGRRFEVLTPTLIRFEYGPRLTRIYEEADAGGVVPDTAAKPRVLARIAQARDSHRIIDVPAV